MQKFTPNYNNCMTTSIMITILSPFTGFGTQGEVVFRSLRIGIVMRFTIIGIGALITFLGVRMVYQRIKSLGMIEINFREILSGRIASESVGFLLIIVGAALIVSPILKPVHLSYTTITAEPTKDGNIKQGNGAKLFDDLGLEKGTTSDLLGGYKNRPLELNITIANLTFDSVITFEQILPSLESVSDSF